MSPVCGERLAPPATSAFDAREQGGEQRDEQGERDSDVRHHLAVARFFQNCFRLSSAPNNVLNTVESASRISPARAPFEGIHTNELNSRLPASVNGCGFDMSIGCVASTLIADGSSVVTA